MSSAFISLSASEVRFFTSYTQAEDHAAILSKQDVSCEYVPSTAAPWRVAKTTTKGVFIEWISN